ncbi:SA1362 family protein [Virgibacillus litoralis]|uniref:Membrane channel-forming protein YqfA (Hemolysin III family) n=1 Tax=Virgibacillus litoralis TaxID=578221 RepID=A0ABS4HHH4_9BACI|nr:SA1362 family protein [Virgibacillus litoralis]MBP1950375.1 putative membrane channel-forming protein YqfA (hemolysin III family) [Virgibacillus litoralis]
MVRNKFSAFVYVIIGLAVIGVIAQLFTNTASFLTNIIMMLGFGIAVFAVIYFVFIKKRTASHDTKKYKQAVKQSKSKYTNQSDKPRPTSKRPQPLQMKKKLNKRASHLRVIDGNKSKRKNRATF